MFFTFVNMIVLKFPTTKYVISVMQNRVKMTFFVLQKCSKTLGFSGDLVDSDCDESVDEDIDIFSGKQCVVHRSLLT